MSPFRWEEMPTVTAEWLNRARAYADDHALPDYPAVEQHDAVVRCEGTGIVTDRIGEPEWCECAKGEAARQLGNPKGVS